MIIAMFTFMVAGLAQIPFLPPEIILYTDRPTYRPGDRVVIIGHAVDEDFNPVPDINVIILIFDTENNPVLDVTASTNQSGMFTITYTIPSNITEGEFLITAEQELGEFSPGLRTFLVCSLCITEPKIAVITTTVPGPTVTTTETKAALSTTTVIVTSQITSVLETAPFTDILMIIFVAIVVALFVVVILAIRKYG